MDENTRTPGKTTISHEVLLTIARLTTLDVDGVSRLSPAPPHPEQVFKRHRSEGIVMNIEDDHVYMDIYVVLKSDVNVREVSRNIQSAVARSIKEMVGMDVGRINIHIEDIDYENEENKEA